MKSLILFVLAVALLAFIPCDAYAGPLGLFPNFHPGQKLAKGVGKVAKGSARVVRGAARATRGVGRVARPIRSRSRGC